MSLTISAGNKVKLKKISSKRKEPDLPDGMRPYGIMITGDEVETQTAREITMGKPAIFENMYSISLVNTIQKKDEGYLIDSVNSTYLLIIIN